MNQVMRDPIWREFNTLSRGLNRMLEGFGHTESNGEGENLGHWSPSVDIYEKGDDITLQAEVPGVKKEDIDIRVENNVLTIRGKRERSEEVKENGYVRTERCYGNFSRSLSLPRTVDSSKISAEYKDGVLSLVLPTAEEAKSKQIDVKVS